MRSLSLLACLLLVTVAASTAPAVAGSTTASVSDTPIANGSDAPADARIVELYPNPVAADNEGEYLVVDLPVAGNWSLTDGYHEVRLPPDVAGRVPLSTAPTAAEAHVDGPVHRLPGRFPLAVDGDRIVLRYDGEVVDVVAYDRAGEAEVWNRYWDGLERDGWRPYGYEPRPPATTDGPVAVDAFVLPDAPDEPRAAIAGADDRLFLAAYSFESRRIADELIAARDRGVDVRVVVEGTPVGGFSARTARTLDRVAEAGIEVRVLDGPRKRFAFHHAKYAVVDDRAVVLTENWKPAGTGGADSRGWGVTAHDAAFARDLAAVFERDATAVDALAWPTVRENVTVHDSSRATASYPARFATERFVADRVELLVAPGNAADGIVDRIDDADDRVLVVGPRTDGADGRIVGAAVAAADRGVESRLLLSGAWYDRRENARLADELNDRARDADAPLSAAVAEPRGRYGKIHAKGVVVDDTVVVGSLNWNEPAATRNREVLVAVESAAAADYFARVYAADWRGGGAHLPVALVGSVVVAVGCAGLLARRRVSFV